MAGVLQGLADFLFGIDPIDDRMRAQQEQYLADQARAYAAREQADYLHQSNYGRMLMDTITGQSPSVADLQLGQGLDSVARQGQSAVAGASGNNAGLMGYGALLNSGNNAIQLEQAKAIQRAMEVQAAQKQLGELFANQGARSAGLTGQTQQVGLGYGQLGTEIAAANQKAKAASLGTLLGAGGAAIGGLVGGPSGAAIGGSTGGASRSYGGSDAASAGAAYSAAQPGLEASNINYGSALTAADMPQDPYQASYADGLYRGPSVDRGQR